MLRETFVMGQETSDGGVLVGNWGLLGRWVETGKEALRWEAGGNQAHTLPGNAEHC